VQQAGMDIKIIFVKTSKGEDESKKITNHLPSDIKRALGLIDNQSTVKELMKRAAPSLRESLDDMLQELIDGGFIQDKDKVSSVVKMAIPRRPIQKIVIPLPKVEGLGERQDAIRGMHVSATEALAAETAHVKAEQEAEKIRVELEVAQAGAKVQLEAKARADAETFHIKAEQEAKKIRAELEVAQARAKAEAKALADAEASRLKVEQEATRIREEQEAAQVRVKEEAEAVRLKAEQVAAQIKEEQEVAQAKVEAEAKARAVVEALHIKEEQEALKARAKEEAEQTAAIMEMEAAVNARAKAEMARLNAEQETLKIRSELEAEQAKSQVEAKAKVYSEAETARLKGEQEETRVRVEQEAALAKKKAEDLRLKAEQEVSDVRYELEAEQAKSQIEAKARARAEAETARLKREQEAARVIVKKVATQAREKMEMAAKVRAKAEESRIIEEQDAIKVKAEHLATLLTIEKAEAKARDEAAARIKAEQDAAKIRVDQDAAKITVDLAAVKIRVDQEAAKIKAAQEAAKVKAAQEAAKVKAAQEAAQTVAKAKMKAAVKIQASQVPEMKAVRRVAKTRSKSLPWGKIATGLILLLLLMVVLLPFVWPMQSYVTQIEQKLSGQLQHPVHVGHLRATLLPQPKLELEDVSFGVTQELKASSVVLNFNFFELLSDIKSIRSLEINDLILNAKSFDKALPWLQIAGGDAHYPVASMVLQRARVSDDELVLPSVNGVVNFDGQRRFAKAVLKSVDGKLSLELQPQKSHWQIALAIKGSYVPLLPNILFNELTAKGELGAGEINFHEIEGSLYGGLLTGSAHLTWLKGWQMQGLVDVKAMKLLDALPQSGIAGEMDGHANFILRGEKLSLLPRTPHLDGKFLIKKGLINKIDMVETSRMPNRKGVSSGHTHFDALSGVLQINNNSQHLRQIKISNSVMSANGYADVAANKQLSGRLNVNLKVRADLGSVPLVLSGTLTEPLWSTAR
jgi:hypothetical protein